MDSDHEIVYLTEKTEPNISIFTNTFAQRNNKSIKENSSMAEAQTSRFSTYKLNQDYEEHIDVKKFEEDDSAQSNKVLSTGKIAKIKKSFIKLDNISKAKQEEKNYNRGEKRFRTESIYKQSINYINEKIKNEPHRKSSEYRLAKEAVNMYIKNQKKLSGKEDLGDSYRREIAQKKEYR